MIPKNKLTFIVLFICVLISCFCHDQSASAQEVASAQKTTSIKKATSIKRSVSVKKKAPTQNGWMLTGYGAKLTPDTLGETMTFDAKYVESYLAVLAVTKKVFSFKIPVDIELEGQVAKHFGKHDNFECNVVPILFRWTYFPWDKYLDTSVAAGAGLSYAFETPEVEEATVGKNHASPKLLGYLMFEFAA